MSEGRRSTNHLEDEINRVIDRFRHEYHITYAELIGVLDTVKIDIHMEMRSVHEDGDEEQQSS